MSIQKTQQQILKHHGGDGDWARQRITETYEKRHGEEFWRCWERYVAVNHAPGDKLIDLGAGIGQFVADCAKRYPDAEVIGIEAAPYMLEEALALPNNAKLLIDDLHNPQAPIQENSASMVMANMVVHELTQPIKMFKAVYQWLKPGGRFCIIDIVRQPLQEYLAHRYPEVSPYADETTVEDLEDAFEHFLEHNRYHPADIIAMLELAGFKIVLEEKVGRFIRIVVEKP